jgi:phage major head subunit gpT-like protein
MANKSGFGDLLEPGFRKIFDDAFKETDRVFTKVFRVANSTKQDERDSAVTGFGLLVPKPAGQPLQYEDPLQMYDVIYTHTTYAKGFKIDKELFDDEQYNIMDRKPQQLGRAARRTEEYQAAAVWNNAFSSAQLGGDAKPLCSTSHPRADGGSSQSNASSTGLPLTETNYETEKLAMRRQLDDKGMKIDTMPTAVLVPIDLEKSANIIFKSKLRSGTADNDLNPYENEVQIIPWIYLTSTTAHFLIDKDQHQVSWFWREKANFKQDETFETDQALFKVRERFSAGFSDWRGVYGSKGDNAAYAG